MTLPTPLGARPLLHACLPVLARACEPSKIDRPYDLAGLRLMRMGIALAKRNERCAHWRFT